MLMYVCQLQANYLYVIHHKAMPIRAGGEGRGLFDNFVHVFSSALQWYGACFQFAENESCSLHGKLAFFGLVVCSRANK